MNFIKHPYGNKKIVFIKYCKNQIKLFIRFILSFLFKFNKNDQIIISSAVHCPWLEDKKFYKFYRSINKYTLLDEPRAYTLWLCSKNLKNLEGNILDIGCLLGGAGFITSKINNKGNTLLFDTFEGFVKSEGIHRRNVFFFKNISFVKKKISDLKLKRTKVFKAHFPKNLKVSIGNIKLCHIDVNTYNETKHVFNYVKNRIIKNGIIIFDDYGIWGVDGVKKFINIIEKKYSNQFIFIKNYMGQCILIKK